MQGGGRSKGFREIISKAVCGFGKKTFRFERLLTIPEGGTPERILGSLFTQVSSVEAATPERSGLDSASVPVAGRFDINVWYSYNGQQGTALAKETVRYSELIPIARWTSAALGNLEGKVQMVEPPQCSEVSIIGHNQIRALVEFTVQAEVIGETKMCVEVFETDD